MKDFNYFTNSEVIKLFLLSLVLSFPFYLYNLFLTLIRNKEKLKEYSLHIWITSKTIFVTYSLIAIELLLVYFFKTGIIQDYFQLLAGVLIVSSIIEFWLYPKI
jgi:hypothetical protein